jgi:hypothetical protein
MTIRSTIGEIAAGTDEPVLLVIADYGAFEFPSLVDARDEAVRLSERVANVRDGLEREGFSTRLLSDAAIVCVLAGGGLDVDGEWIEPDTR